MDELKTAIFLIEDAQNVLEHLKKNDWHYHWANYEDDLKIARRLINSVNLPSDYMEKSKKQDELLGKNKEDKPHGV